MKMITNVKQRIEQKRQASYPSVGQASTRSRKNRNNAWTSVRLLATAKKVITGIARSRTGEKKKNGTKDSCPSNQKTNGTKIAPTAANGINISHADSIDSI